MSVATKNELRSFKIPELKDIIRKHKISVTTKSGSNGKTYIKKDYMDAIIKHKLTKDQLNKKSNSPDLVMKISSKKSSVSSRVKKTLDYFENRPCNKTRSKVNPNAYTKPELIARGVKELGISKVSAAKLSKPELCYLLQLASKSSDKKSSPKKSSSSSPKKSSSSSPKKSSPKKSSSKKSSSSSSKKSPSKKSKLAFKLDCLDADQQCAKKGKICKVVDGKGSCVTKNNNGKPRGIEKLKTEISDFKYDEENNILGSTVDVQEHIKYWKTLRNKSEKTVSDKCGEADMNNTKYYKECNQGLSCDIDSGKCIKPNNNRHSKLTVGDRILLGDDNLLKTLQERLGGTLHIYKKSDFKDGTELAQTGKEVDVAVASEKLKKIMSKIGPNKQDNQDTQDTQDNQDKKDIPVNRAILKKKKEIRDLFDKCIKEQEQKQR